MKLTTDKTDFDIKKLLKIKETVMQKVVISTAQYLKKTPILFCCVTINIWKQKGLKVVQ